ncbi:protein kinase domain-containing protein [Flavobacterium sp. I3-2]|uniref:protein kinase domain-containing protein n=1 Tax=Flavobacterium sp. I3-2 TaxID=2748319 RepID=UPI0015AC3A1E|nr:protein kinase [Flavobacterium sp. I3-2]
MKKLQKYKIVNKLGQGGNGFVEKVIDKKGNYFAKKTLKNTTNKKAYLRFIDEITILSKINHSNIIEIIEAHTPTIYISKNEAYYIMPIGIPLKDYIKRSNLDEQFTICEKIIDALVYLHSQDITHRDIKIENIIIVDREPQLSDFGLANFPRKERISGTNEKIGPAFTIAPEMRRISTIANYKKADVYSLAKTIYAILTKNWLTFDGQYNRFSNFSLMNNLDVKINKMRLIGVTEYNSILLLEKLLEAATHNDPEKRPTIVEFQESFSFWLKSNSNYKLRNSIEWNDALLMLFPFGITESARWTNTFDIRKVLNILFNTYDALNHSFFPISGGLDFEIAEIIKINGIDFILINNSYLMKPKELIFESMQDTKWSYFRLELQEMKPFFNKKFNHKNEEIIFIDEHNLIFEEPNDTSKELSLFLQGSFLIVQKMAIINSLNGEFDHYMGLHNKMTNDEYKLLLKDIQAHITV